MIFYLVVSVFVGTDFTLIFLLFSSKMVHMTNKIPQTSCVHNCRKQPDGIHILWYHNFVHRKEAGQHIKQKVFVTKFGRPHANAKIDISATPGVYDSKAQKFLDCGQPKLPIPNTSIRTGKDGIAELKWRQ